MPRVIHVMVGENLEAQIWRWARNSPNYPDEYDVTVISDEGRYEAEVVYTEHEAWEVFDRLLVKYILVREGEADVSTPQD